ncbi:hypothetical protein MmiHf6_14550 [Methanimicrococcus hongohii]|uniref:Uncharacterized protein n=1 Tax=Methanimicrococcus hongohii TaxID=3028295 RepID=A0AA96ZUB2_9EURY|nr:DUF6019 family protein [Methanimicrococcus sp. Hf6]WNY24126.1 hypothetical protein MmiHf6_14550 [Methanimicrococcus sp. Hf6]
MFGIGIIEILMILVILILYLVPIALILIALYYIIKAAVKNGILEADEEKRMRNIPKQEEIKVNEDENEDEKENEDENEIKGDAEGIESEESENEE